ncbi:unnamed protein product [Ectocarpus sp. 6 AP-2014]
MSNVRIDEIAYRLVSNPWFDRVIVLTIIVNCYFLALYDPTRASNEQDGYIIVGDYMFSSIFIAELLAKWLALSIPTYFKDKWNWVDFVVVLESAVSLVLKAFKSTSSLDISALRGLRVLRPLRAITYIQQVKLLFETVISAFKVVNTLLLCVGIVMLFFGNVGYTYWAESFAHTCEDAVTSDVLSDDVVCGKGYSCPDGYVCTDSGHVALNDGVTGYHDIWHALLQTFQVVSLDGWQQVMWHTQDSAGEETWIFFVALLVLGNVVLVSMFPAVVSSKLEAAIAREEIRKRKRIQAEKGKGEGLGEKKGPRVSEFEMLLNEYANIEADEIAAIERLAAVQRGEVREKPEEEAPLPRWTPFPANSTMNRLRKAILLDLGIFSIIVYIVIFLNAMVLCLDSAHASDRRERVLSYLHEAFTSLFVMEMAIKLGLLGPIGYFRDGFNIFDFAITWLGLIEITLQVGGFVSGLRVIRIFRIARVFRLASLGKLGRKKFNASPQVDLGRMISIITTSIPWIVNIYVVQLLLMYTFAVLGMQFFGGDLEDVESEGDNSIRFNYNSFGKATVTLLDLLTGNVWSELMFDTVAATGQQSGILFYVAWLILSRWLAVAMVVTVLFNRIDVDTEDYLKIAAKHSMRSLFALEHAFMQCHKSHAFLTWRKRYEEATGNRSSTRGQMKLLEYSPPAAQPGLWQKVAASKKSLLIFGPQNRFREFCRWLTTSAAVVPPSPLDIESERNASVGAVHHRTSRSGRQGGGVRRGTQGDMLAGSGRPNASSALSTRGHQGCWRRFLRRRKSRRLARLAHQTAQVSAVVVTLVVVSLDAELVSGRRTEGVGTTRLLLETASVWAFLADALLCIVAQGLVLLPGGYLRDPSNVLAFILTILSAICLWGFGGTVGRGTLLSVSTLKALRGLNVFRLLRLAELSRSLTDLLRSLRSSGKALCLVGGVVVFFWLQWAIVGLQVWEGTFGYCSDPVTAEAHGEEVFYVYHTSENGIEGQQECEAEGYEWGNATWNFDNFGNALQSVLIIFTYDGWQNIMFNAINARVADEGLNGSEWNNTWAALFFLFVLLLSLVLVLLFVGMVFSMYTFINLTKRSGQRLSSLKQAFWTMYEAKLAKVQPDTVLACPADAPAVRRLLFNAASKRRWGIVLASLIGANVVVRFLIGSNWLHYFDAPSWIHLEEAVFAPLFVLEWVCRAIAFGGVRAITRSYFQMVDFFSTLVLALVFVEEILFLSNLTPSSSASFWRAVEAASMVRLVRLGQVLPNAQEFLLVIAKSSSVVFPLLLVLTALTYLWSVFGVLFFGNETYLAGLFGDGNPWETVNRHQGFFSVAQGMQTMIGVATTPGSNGWITLMQRYEDVTSPQWRWAVVTFFGSYALLTRFLLVQFFMITLLFKYKTHSYDKAGVAIEQVNQFKQAWMAHAYRYTKEYTSIYAGQLVDLLRELPPPLGIGKEGSYYDCQILAKKVLIAIGIDVVAHVPAEDLTGVLSLYGSTVEPAGSKPLPVQRNGFGSGPGSIRLNFSKVLVAVHRIVLFDLTLEDERQVNERRNNAMRNLTVATTRAQQEGVALRECSVLRTQLPATFRARISMALTAEFLRWKDHVDLWGCDGEADLLGRCLLEAASHEINATAAVEQLTTRLFESHVGDRKLVTRLAEIRQHLLTLKGLRVKLNAARGDYLQTSWDGGSLRVRQTIGDEERNSGITGVCASVDGVWVFCTTDDGLLKVFKRGKPPRRKGKKRINQQGAYALVQNMGVNGDIPKGSNGGKGSSGSKRTTRGLCVACSPDGFIVMAGCSDSGVRTFCQDNAGFRRAVHEMKAAGIRGRKPPILYRPTSVGKGHKAAVRCVTWLHPSYFYTGGEDGTVCMWNKSAANRPAQFVDVCRSNFSSGPVRCLSVWRTTYSTDLLAACFEVDDGQEVDPPVYLLAGDGDGYLSVLPARTDSSFFAIDIWKTSLRHQVVDASGGAVTALEVAWGRVYTASGLAGVIKAWTPLWDDATKEKLLGFSPAGQYAVHSGEVSSIVYAKGLMFSAGADMSIITWYPPRETGTSGRASASPPSPHDEEQTRLRRHNSGSTEEPSPALLAPPSPAPALASNEGGIRTGVKHENDPGVVVHVAEVIGIAVVPGALVSADAAGRLLERGPSRHIERHCRQILPSDEAIQRLRPLALEVLRTRAHARRTTPAHGAGAAAGAVAATAAGTDTAVVAQQAVQDHLRAVRFLLRAKAKRRVKEEIRVEKQKAADLQTAAIFASRLGQQARRPMLGAGRAPRDSASSDRSSASETFVRARRRSILSSVSMRPVAGQGGEGISQQEAADVSKLADMDQKPAFLETADLERLVKNPDVYLAELMRHFFPGRDLAPSRSPGSREAAADTRNAPERIARSIAGGRGKRPSASDSVKVKGKGDKKKRFPAAATNFSSTIDAARRAAMRMHARSHRSEASRSSSDGGGSGEGEVVETGDTEGHDDLHIGNMEGSLVRTETALEGRSLGALLLRATRDIREGIDTKHATQELAVAAGKGEEGEEEEGTEEEKPRPHALEPDANNVKQGPESSASLNSNEDRSGTSTRAGTADHKPEERTRQLGGAGSAIDQSSTGQDEDTSFVGDNYSTAQMRRKGYLTVFVPHSPSPGVWAASVEYDSERDVAWVLAEALRMYATEHSPVARHAGLARRPRLVERSPTRWGLFRGNSKESWEQGPVLSAAAPVLSVLRPGEELVVLVEGFDPAAAFARRPSVVALPPVRNDAAPGASTRIKGDRDGSLSLPTPPVDDAASMREDALSDGSRAPSDGPRRFAGISEPEAADACTRVSATHTCGGGDSRGGAGDSLSATGGDQVPGAATLVENGPAMAEDIKPGAYYRGRKSQELGDEGAYVYSSDDSLTDEEDKETRDDDDDGDDEGYYHYQNPYYAAGDARRPIGGNASLRRNSPPQSRLVTDASVTTRGVTERCENANSGGGGSRSRGLGSVAAGGERRDERQAGDGFPQDRSPPRSLVARMYAAWGEDNR